MTENQNTKCSSENPNVIDREKAYCAIHEALAKLEYIGLGVDQYQIDGFYGRPVLDLPMGLRYMIDDIESQIRIVKNYFLQPRTDELSTILREKVNIHRHE